MELTNKAKDYTGKKFGTCLAVRPIGKHRRNIIWELKCDCGKIVNRLSGELITGKFCSKSCPLLASKISDQKSTHKKSKHKLFAVWRSMNDRCRLPSHQAWENYGGRGITVCPEWQYSFQAFWDQMYPSWLEGLCLDRIDNNKGYSFENCRWSTHQENMRNTRRSRIPGWVLDQSDKNGIARSTLLFRINAGVSFEIASTLKPSYSNRYSTSETADLKIDSSCAEAKTNS